MSKSNLLSQSEEEQVIKHRFLTQATVARGEPPFKKLTKRCALDVLVYYLAKSGTTMLSHWFRFLQFCDEAERGSADAAEKAFDALVREISVIELQVRLATAVPCCMVTQRR